MRAARASWILFDWAAQPYFTLVTTFLFAPYFAAHFIGDPVRGQALWGQTQAVGGLIIAVCAPLLGAMADQAGRRKPWIAVFSLATVAGSAALWFALPGGAVPVFWVLTAIVISLVGVEFATAFTNAMLPELAGPGRIGRLSGQGWSFGYAGGIVSLALILGFIAPAAGGTATLLGFEPLITFAAPFGAERLTGPFSALWYAIFVVPLFVFVPEPRTDAKPLPMLKTAVAGLGALAAQLREVRRIRNVLVFLIARMAYFDGLTALFAFAGIYAAGQFGWTSQALGIYGIIITVFAALGAAAAGPVDDRAGPKAVCLVSLCALLICVLLIGSLGRDHILFVIDTAPAREGELFASWPERWFLVLSATIGIFAGPVQASSRSLMARISPERQMTAFFGLYALSGKATAFAAPLAVALVTAWTGSQRAGAGVIVVFFAIGLVLLWSVKETRDGAAT